MPWTVLNLFLLSAQKSIPYPISPQGLSLVLNPSSSIELSAPPPRSALTNISLGYRNSKRVITPSQIYSQNRFTFLGHLFRHKDSLEFHSTFMPPEQYRYTRGPNRISRPSLHWAESVISEASNKLHHMESDEPPTHYESYHLFFFIPNINVVPASHISS